MYGFSFWTAWAFVTIGIAGELLAGVKDWLVWLWGLTRLKE